MNEISYTISAQICKCMQRTCWCVCVSVCVTCAPTQVCTTKIAKVLRLVFLSAICQRCMENSSRFRALQFSIILYQDRAEGKLSKLTVKWIGNRGKITHKPIDCVISVWIHKRHRKLYHIMAKHSVCAIFIIGNYFVLLNVNKKAKWVFKI